MVLEPIEIVQLQPDEWPAYRKIRLEALRTEPQAFGSSYANNLQHPDTFWQRRLQQALAGEEGWLLFARSQGQLVGLIGAYVSETPGVADIISVYVTPAHRGRGIAKRLMDAMIDTLRATGSFHKLTLTVNTQQTAAIALYRQFGFQITGQIRSPMGDGQLYDEHVMERVLD